MSTAAVQLAAAVGDAADKLNPALAGLAGITVALADAQAAAAQLGSADKIALLSAFADKLRTAQAAEHQAQTALAEMQQLAAAVAGQPGLVPTGSGGQIVHPAARPDPPADTTPRLPGGGVDWKALGERLGLTPDPPPPQPTPQQCAADKTQFLGAALTPDEIADYLALLGTRDTKTRGAWIENGQLVEIISGRHDLAYEQAINYWRVGWQHHYPTVRGWQGDLATHAEVKAAIQMRWEGTSNRHRTMVINHAGGPCGGDLGCQDYLDTFIPPGCSLTVYYPGGYRIFGGRER